MARVAVAQRLLDPYVRSLVGPWADPEGILREVNLALCRKAHEYDGGRFLTWACRVAYLQVLAHLKRRLRERCRYVDETLLAELAELAGPPGDLSNEYLRLPDKSRMRDLGGKPDAIESGD